MLAYENSQMGDSGISINPEEIQIPRFPIKTDSGHVSKMEKEQGSSSAWLYVEPADLKGQFDFGVDIQAMTVNAESEKKDAMQAAISLIISNPNVTQMLMMEGTKPKFKDLFVTWLEDLGFQDAERYFEQAPQQGQPSANIPGTGQPPGITPPTGNEGGIPGGTNPNAGGEASQTSPFASQELGPVSPKALGEIAQ
jgi:hypothetical protein